MANRVFIPATSFPTEGSHKSFVNPKTGKVVTKHADPNLDTWRDTVALFVRNFPKYGKHVPVGVGMVFYFPRGKTVTREHHVVKPDGDKVDRAVFDALTKARVVWDDAQITDHYVRKRYADDHAPGLVLVVTDDPVTLFV